MAVFKYISVDEKGKSHKGVMQAASAQDIRQDLADRKLTLLELTEVNEQLQQQKPWYTFRKKKLRIATLSLITFQLGTLLSAGLTISAALQNMSEQIDNPYLKTVLLTVRTRIAEGHTLADGMNEFPDVFPELYRATIAAGTKSGHLDEVINKLAAYLEQQEYIRQKIQQAMIYPVLLMLVSSTIIIFLLTYAMPKITKTFVDSGQPLPLMTSILLNLSEGLKSYGIYILILFFLASAMVKHLLKAPTFQFRTHLFLLKIPLISHAMTITNAARFLKTFGILFGAGVPVAQAMQTANSIITLLPMKTAVKSAITHIVEGTSIHHALLQTGYFTKLSTQLIASGEKSGQLDIMLDKSATFQEKQVLRWITTSLALLEPIMILFMGVVVLFIVLAILLPIFQMNELLN